MKRTSAFGLILLLLASFFLALAPVQAQDSSSDKVIVLYANGELSPIMAEYIERGIATAENQQAAAIILGLNTPGGGVDLMNRMVEDIRASTVPVVVYVSPNGAMAGSAGTMITLAGHLAAMAPETTIGAASPVQSSGQDIGGTLQTKITNILAATARSLAERRGPKAQQLASDMITNAKAVSATEAYQAKLIDFIARDNNDLLRQMDGAKVTVNGQTETVSTKFVTQEPLPMSFIEQAIGLLTNPNLILILLNVGVVALLIELSSPGGWVAGFIGVVCLALAVYGLGLLPVNWFGIIFMILAFVLFILDIKAPTHGALTAAGAASFIVGALVLFNSPGVPAVQRVSVPLAIGAGLSTALIFFVALMIALRAQHIPVLTGQGTLVGKTGTAKTDLCPRGTVQVGGEQWSAEIESGSPAVSEGAEVVVVDAQGLRLIVRRAL